MKKNRYITGDTYDDLQEKMVFVGGPRQVGKTFLAVKLIAPLFRRYTYFNWDNRVDRKKLIRSELPGSAGLVILDEIHKYKKWKSLVKGEYDTHGEKYNFLVTGSARLNVYRKGGDSLQGRYHYYRLHPFTLSEILDKNNTIHINRELNITTALHEGELDILERFGGFPEMCLKQNPRSLRRWHNEKIERLFSEDIRDMTMIRDISSMKLLSDILPERTGSLLSINSIREDLEVSHRAVSLWLDVLEQFYYHFRIYPYNRRRVRSIRKYPKLYLFDWSEIENEGIRFENMVACHLLKLVHFLKDRDGYRAELYFLRNVDRKEVDFLVCIDKKPWFCVETKLNEVRPSKSLKYYTERLKIPWTYQVVRKRDIDIMKDGTRIISAGRFLGALV